MEPLGDWQRAHPPAVREAQLLAHAAERAAELERVEAEEPAKWTSLPPVVILDVFSRYIVGWTIQYREDGQLAKALIEQATCQQQITPKILTLYADRGAPQQAKPWRSSSPPRHHEES